MEGSETSLTTPASDDAGSAGPAGTSNPPAGAKPGTGPLATTGTSADLVLPIGGTLLLLGGILTALAAWGRGRGRHA